MGWDAPWHWIVLALVVIALFGYKKLPDASRSLGRSLRIFKTEIKGMTEDDKVRSDVAVPPAVAPPATAQTPVAAPAPIVTPPVIDKQPPVTTPGGAAGTEQTDSN